MCDNQNPFQTIKSIINDIKLTNKLKFQQIIEFIDSFEGSDAEAEFVFYKAAELNRNLRKDIWLAHDRQPIEVFIRFLVSLNGTGYPMKKIREKVIERFGEVDSSIITDIATKAKGRGRTSLSSASGGS
jgi:hypothetical protein